MRREGRMIPFSPLLTSELSTMVSTFVVGFTSNWNHSIQLLNTLQYILAMRMKLEIIEGTRG